jgi:hypothetical protein
MYDDFEPFTRPPGGILTRIRGIRLNAPQETLSALKGVTMTKKFQVLFVVALTGIALLLLQSTPASAQGVAPAYTGPIPSQKLVKQVPNRVEDVFLTAPASGCPCLAFVSYFLPIQAGSTDGGLVESEVVNESNPSEPFAVTEQTVPAGANRGIQRSDLDTTSVANGQNVEFRLLVEPGPGGMQIEEKSKLFYVSGVLSIFWLPYGLL